MSQATRSAAANAVILLAIGAFVIFVLLALEAEDEGSTELYDIAAGLRQREYADLSHSLDAKAPHRPEHPGAVRSRLLDYGVQDGDAGGGLAAELFTHPGEWGTHVDAPRQAAEGLSGLDEFAVDSMIMPLVVIDVHGKVADDPDYTVTREDVVLWERSHGPIPAGAFVALRTDWSERWPDPKAMRNEDDEGVAHYPGWSRDVLEYLYESRNVGATGHETLSAGPGVAASVGDHSLDRYVLEQGAFQVELLTNLDEAPPFGAVIVVAVPKVAGGAAFPARVFAILPEYKI